MIVEIAKLAPVYLHLPGRMRQGERTAEEWVGLLVEAVPFRSFRLLPVLLSLPGVIRQPDKSAALREEPFPVDRHPLRIKLAQSVKNKLLLAFEALQGGDYYAAPPDFRETFADGGPQSGVRPYLQEDIVLVLDKRLDRLGEVDRFPDVLPPVF